jgi:hypothetical protein
MRLITSLLATVMLAAVAAAPAQAAKLYRHHHRASTYAYGQPQYQGGVLRGPLYNGQDYLGDDPDPNIRSYLLRDLTGRYGGGR